MDTDRTLRPDERSFVVCPKCGNQTAVLARDASQGQARCNHCTAVLGRELLALGITPPSQGSVSEHPTDIVENHPFGRYLLKKELGRGGMGVVWLAEDPTLGRQVAIKLLSGAGAEDVARFEREARTAASLSHPNIAPIYEVGVQDGRPYLAMQYIKGRTLDQAIVERKVSARAGAEIVRDAARAVHHANESGVIHRDLKPQNIMIQTEDSKTSRIYVLDFGLARRTSGASSISVSGTVVGTPAFMSPEQASGSPDIDARADVYGLGATLYALVTGRPPFEGTSPIDIIMKVANTDPTPPRRIHPGMHQDLETIIQTAMARERERRYPTAAALAEDLQRFLDNEPIKARPASLMYHLSRRVRKHPAWVAAIFALLLAVSLTYALLSMQTGRKKEREANTLRARQALTDGRWAEARGLFQSLVEQEPNAEFSDAILKCEAELARERQEREAAERAARFMQRLDDAEQHFESARYDPVETWRIIETSLKDLDAALTATPGVAALLTQRARVHRLMHRLKLARRDIDRAIEIDPHHRPARLERIRLIFEQISRTMAGVDRGNEGLKWMDDNLEIATKDEAAVRAGTGSIPPRAEKYLRLADLLRGFMAKALRPKAKEDLEREADERRDADFWFYLATFRFSDEDRVGALEALKKSLEIRPSNAAAIFLQADWADWAGDPALSVAEALKKFDEAIRLDPHDFRGYVNRSSIRFQQKDFEATVRDLRAAVAIDPDQNIPWQNLYVVGQATKNTDLMMEASEAFIRIRPNTAQGLSMRADTYAARREFSKMLEDLAAAAEKEPANAFVRRRYGDVLYQRNRLNEALAQFEVCVKLDPENPKGYHGRAKVLLAMGDEARALPDLERYAKAVPEDFAVWLDIARVRFTVGPLEQALPAIEHVLKREPKNYDALSLKGDVLRALNEGQDALDAYNAAVEIDETRPEARVGRAWLLQNNNYGAEAMADLEYVLERYPKHEHARALRARDHMVHKRWAEALRDIDAVIGIARQMKKDLERMRETCELNLNKKE